MALVKVWNDNVHPFTQEFKNGTIKIPPKEFVEMDYEEAIEFKSKFSPISVNGDGVPLPESYKMIRVERPKITPTADLSLVNHATGERAATKEELEAMLREHRHLLVKDDDLDSSGPSRLEIAQAKNAELEARLEAIEAMLAAQAPKKAAKK